MNSVTFVPMLLHQTLLATQQIDVWEFPLDQLPTGAMELLNAEEQHRANRFHFERHQRRFTVARAMLRWVLGHYLEEDPRDLCFDYNKQGKPSLAHSSAIEFNLSHSKDTALLAIGQKYPMGIDIEYYSERSYEGIAQHSFSPAEIVALEQVPATSKAAAFFDIWAHKEAFIKACGLGLSYPTQEFTVCLPKEDTFTQPVYDDKHQQYWMLYRFTVNLVSACALCYNPAIQQLRKISVQPCALI